MFTPVFLMDYDMVGTVESRAWVSNYTIESDIMWLFLLSINLILGLANLFN